MIDHLPECLRIYQVTVGCICPVLRDCEQRVEEAMDRAWTHTLRIKQAEAYANGVAAAREAVAGLLDEFPNPEFQIANAAVHTALAAIDALKEDK